MARSKNVKEIVVPSRLRRYEYKSRVCTKTGRILGVRAGCRRWSGFKQAFDHYDGGGKYNVPHFQRHGIIKRTVDCSAEWSAIDNLNRWADRRDAIATLKLLRQKTERLQKRIRKA